MAGIGEASAILAIAQVGVKFSVTIWEFAGEVRGARKEIGRLVRNIRTTSERLQDIGRLLKENSVSHLFNEGGIESAVRCSNDCEDIISDVTKVLVKAGREPNLRSLEQNDLDITKLEALFRPFVKKKLVSPQADLERVKADLMLLLHSAMALKSESIKHRTESTGSRARIPTQRDTHRKDSEDQVDPEMRQRFLEFQIKLAEEAEDRRVQERAAYLHAEDVERQEAEDASRNILEQNAINAYKQEQEDRDARALEREKQLEDALTEHGLEQDKIQSIMKIPCLQIPESGNANTSVSKVRHPRSTEADHENSSTEASPVPTKHYSNSSWLYRIFSKTGKAQTPVINEAAEDDLKNITGNRLGFVCRMELWLIDVLSGQVTELETSQKWLESHMKKTKHHDTLRRLAQMRHQWQMAVQHCLRLRNEREVTGRLWRLFSIGFPRKVSRVALFGHYRGDCLIQLAICQREDSHVSDQSAPWLLPPQFQIPDVSTASGLKDAPPVTSTGNKHPTTAEQAAKNVDANQVSMTGKGYIQKPVKNFNVQDEKSGRLVDSIHTVIIEEGRDDRDDTTLGDFTLIPKDLIQASALEELDYGFSHVPDSKESDPREFLRVPSALDDDEIKKLVTVSIEQIKNKQASLIRLPERFKTWRHLPNLKNGDESSDSGSTSSVEDDNFVDEIVETDYRIYEDTPGNVVIEKKQTRITCSYARSDPHASDSSIRAIDAKDTAEHEPPASHDGARLSRGNAVRRSEHNDIRFSSNNPRQHTRGRDAKCRPAGRPFMHTHHDSERHLDPYRENRFTPRPTPIREWDEIRDEATDHTYENDNLARGAGADQDHYRRKSFERIRQSHGHAPVADPYRMRPTFYGGESRTGDGLKAANNQNASNLRSDAGLLPLIHDDPTTTRHEKGMEMTIRPEQLNSGRIQEAAQPKDDSLLHPNRQHPWYMQDSSGLIVPRSASQANRPASVVIHNNNWEDHSPTRHGRHHRRNSLGHEAGRLVRFESRSNVRHPMRRLTGYESPRRTLSRHRDSKHDAQRHYQEVTNNSQGRNIPEAKEDEEDKEDVISRTLKRYTTFNSDNDPDLVASPDEAGSSDLSDHDTFDLTTLEQAKETLRRLVKKQEKASMDGDLMEESDLKYYAIPDVEARIQQFTSQQDQGLEDGENKVEHDGRDETFLPPCIRSRASNGEI